MNAPTALVAFVAAEIDSCADGIEATPASEQTRRRHAAELQRWLRLRPLAAHRRAELSKWLLPHVVGNIA